MIKHVLVTVLAVVASSFLTWWAVADSGAPKQSSLMPYRGRLELNGAAANESLALRFTLYDESDNPVWTETHSDVPVVAGRFSVLLGSVNPLSNTELRYASLYLGIDVDSGAGFFSLSGRQLLGALPYSWGGAPGQDFTVDGQLSVGGAAVVSGQATVGSLTVNGDSSFSGLISASSVAATAVTVGGYPAVTGDTVGGDCRMKMYTTMVDVNIALPGYTDAQCVWVNNGILGRNPGGGCYYGLDADNEWDARNLSGHYAVHPNCGPEPGLLVCCR